ncbi:MAG: hypothetical protein HY589_05785 [Candidatus Omnitrophica bacterium]|nr:hypothetical protein [Candidatus Omnitrophota bacterium]
MLTKKRGGTPLCLIVALCYLLGSQDTAYSREAPGLCPLRPLSTHERLRTNLKTVDRKAAVQKAVSVLREGIKGLNRVIDEEINRLSADGQVYRFPEKAEREFGRLFLEASEAAKGIPEFDRLATDIRTEGFSCRLVRTHLTRLFLDSGFVIAAGQWTLQHNGRLLKKAPFVLVDKISDLEAEGISNPSVRENEMLGERLRTFDIITDGESPIESIGVQQTGAFAIYGFSVGDANPIIQKISKIKEQMRLVYELRQDIRRRGRIRQASQIRTGNAELDRSLNWALAQLLVNQWSDFDFPGSFSEFQRRYLKDFIRIFALHETIHQFLGPLGDERHVYLAEVAISPMPWLVLHGIISFAYDRQQTALAAHGDAERYIMDKVLLWIFETQPPGSLGTVEARLHQRARAGARSNTALLEAAPKLRHAVIKYYATIRFIAQLEKLKEQYWNFFGRGTARDDPELYEACAAAAARVSRIHERLMADFRPASAQAPDISVKTFLLCNSGV